MADKIEKQAVLTDRSRKSGEKVKKDGCKLNLRKQAVRKATVRLEKRQCGVLPFFGLISLDQKISSECTFN